MKLDKIKTMEELKLAKNKFYSPKGIINKLQQQIRSAPFKEKKIIGQKITSLKQEAEKSFVLKAKEIKNAQIKKQITEEWIDVTLPNNSKGSLHPLSLVENKFREWFIQNGYFETIGSEIESDEFNFERLNIPKEHPAREMQDSLYLDKTTLLRTHNTSFTARELLKNKNKAFSHFTIGKVYRKDEDDQTHSHQFTQVDFVAIGNYSIPNLIWTLKSLISYVLEKETKIRLRPSYFPFTEPSIEVDIKYQSQWIEILGAGMLHKNVLKIAGYTNDMNAIAAGIGIERIAMIKYNIDDIREFYKNDLRFLNQFKEFN